MKSLADCRLYTFIDTGYLQGRSVSDVARKLCDGGADLVQLRGKYVSPDQIHHLAEEILPITAKAGVGLVINDHPTIATAVRADFCHLGQEDLFGVGHGQVSELRRQNPQLKIGLSTHAPAQAERAIGAGADYIAIGPVYPTATKPGATPVTLKYVRWAAANVQIPWFAIGGITLQNVNDVLDAGARRICIVSAILNSDDIAGTCQAFKARLTSAA